MSNTEEAILEAAIEQFVGLPRDSRPMTVRLALQSLQSAVFRAVHGGLKREVVVQKLRKKLRKATAESVLVIDLGDSDEDENCYSTD